MKNGLPENQGLYDSRFEHDSCGVGFVCHVKGKRSHDIVCQSLQVLQRLSHRGATGADPKTGDGAGILIQIPHEFFVEECLKAGIELPRAGNYGVGTIFLPRKASERKKCKEIVAAVVAGEGQKLLGWRAVPVDDADIGKAARATQPVIEQVFIKKSDKVIIDEANNIIRDSLYFERRLYVIRKRIEAAVRKAGLGKDAVFYITNLSCRTLCYKGLLMPTQLEGYFPELKDPRLSSAIALVHSRYSTNTFPTWDRAQPMRYLAHNGEINTLRGNINWMRSREAQLASKFFDRDVKKLKPVIAAGGSDSAALDNVFELLLLSGRPLAHAMMMLVPSAWEQSTAMGDRLRSFYQYHACLTEPWDGPAALVFTDGVRVAAVLDRNGLRPCRYLLTKDDRVIMASEVGVLDLAADQILASGRLEPGKFFFVNTEVGRIIEDRELKELISVKQPYRAWLDQYMTSLTDLPAQKPGRTLKAGDVRQQLQAFGYTREDLNVILRPMVTTAQEPVGSMGNDTPHAVLSQHPQLLYSYFKQLFAQVTNPAIDPIREELVMSLTTYLGPESNLLEEKPQNCHKLFIKGPVLTNEDLEKIRHIRLNSFKTKTISLLFDAAKPADFSKTIERVQRQAHKAIEEGFTFIVLSDRGVDAGHAALPALLACGAVHHFLVEKALRTQIGIIVESAEPREVHHFALLFGFGADCVNPYLAFEAVRQILDEDKLAASLEEAVHTYIKAVNKGLLKILSKMGISTLQSYRGAQIFEALGLDESVINRCFKGTVSRIGGANLDVIAAESLQRHRRAFAEQEPHGHLLETGGLYQYKRDGEFHLWNPQSIAALQQAEGYVYYIVVP